MDGSRFDGFVRTLATGHTRRQALLGVAGSAVAGLLGLAGVERMQLDTLRLRLLKIGGRVWQGTNRDRLRLAASHPGQPLWDHLAAHRHRRE